ncbi:peptidylprolyl isomerase [bacterium]|nr:peptidylprolyl isomerase [bacterium]
MKRIILPITLMMIFAALLLTNCSGPSGDSVATVGSETITVTTLQEDRLRAYRTPAAAGKQTLETRLNILQTMITTQLKKLEAADRGLSELPEIKAKAQEYLESEAVNKLYELEIVNVVAGDEAIARFYENDRLEVKAAHVLLVWPQDATAADSADVRMRADEIYQKSLQDGDFAKLAGAYTEEPGGKERGGDLGWFGWGRMDPLFQEVAWQMRPGSISEPVETRFGIHIIHLEERREKSLPPLEDVKIDIERKIMQSQRQQVADMVDAYFSKLHETYQLTFSDKLDELLTLINTTNSEGNPFAGLDGEVKGWVVATTTQHEITVQDMEDKVNETPRAGIEFPTRESLEELVDGIAIPLLLTAAATQKGLLENPEVVARADLALARDLDLELTRIEVDEKVNVTEEMQRAFFNEHTDQFMTKPTVQVQEIFVSDETKAQELVARARAGVGFKGLAIANTERTSAQAEGGLLPPFPPGRYGEMGKIAFTLEVGEIAGPIALGSKFSIIKLISRTEATPMPYEEAERMVRSTLEQELREKAQQELMEKLLAKYTVVVDTERVRTLFM